MNDWMNIEHFHLINTLEQSGKNFLCKFFKFKRHICTKHYFHWRTAFEFVLLLLMMTSTDEVVMVWWGKIETKETQRRGGKSLFHILPCLSVRELLLLRLRRLQACLWWLSARPQAGVKALLHNQWGDSYIRNWTLCRPTGLDTRQVKLSLLVLTVFFITLVSSSQTLIH